MIERGVALTDPHGLSCVVLGFMSLVLALRRITETDLTHPPFEDDLQPVAGPEL